MSEKYKMYNIKEKSQKPTKVSAEYYPSISLTEEQIKKLREFNLKDKITIHAHGTVSATSQYNNEPKRYTVELKEADIKHGHNPYPGVPSHLTKKMEDCVRKVKASGSKVNPYAVCHASIMGKHKKKNKEYSRKAIKKIGK